MTQVPATTGLTWLITGYVVTSLGFGPLATPATHLVVGSAPPERTGSASSPEPARPAAVVVAVAARVLRRVPTGATSSTP